MAECDVPVPRIPGTVFGHFFVVSEKIGTEKSTGTSIGKIWYRKKSQNRYWENLVPQKVPVSKIFGTRKNLVPEKSINIGIV